MLIAGVSFMVAGFVQISIQNADTSLSSGHAKVIALQHACVHTYMCVNITHTVGIEKHLQFGSIF